MELLNDDNVKNLAETFDLKMPDHYAEVSDYYELDGFIVIKSVKMFDRKGNFIKLADNSKLVENIHNFPIRFLKL